MKKAIGKASSASTTVTAAAMPMVRAMIARLVGSETSVWKLSSVNVCSSSWVVSPMLQNPVTRRITSEPR